MTVGVYIDDIDGENGGAATFLNTIRYEIEKSSDVQDKFIFCFHGGRKCAYKQVRCGWEYINVDVLAPRRTFIKKVCNKIIRHMGGEVCTSARWSAWDKVARREKIDIFWFTAPVLEWTTFPYIYTVWDLGHRSAPFFPELSRYGSWEVREELYQTMVYKASYILTGNETGKREILENYRMNGDKVKIAPFPLSSFCFDGEIPVSELENEEFFFYPAQFWPHKNHIVILQALVLLREKYGLKPKIVFTGADQGNRSYVEKLVSEFNLEMQVIFMGFIETKKVKWLYGHAIAMVYASLLGPNNMPPIEATCLSCPIIITNLEGHREQLKNSALYFDGYSSESLAHCMKMAMDKSAEFMETVRLQPILAEKFREVSYLDTIISVLDDFRKKRQRWGTNYV